MEQTPNIRLIQASLVLLAKDVNAGGINRDYLAAKEIVPDSWGWEVSSNTIATPIASVVNYSNETSVLAQVGRIQTAHDGEGFDPMEMRLDTIMGKYVQANPDLHYTTIGTNFRIAVYDIDLQPFLKDTLIQHEVTADLGFDEVRTVELVSNNNERILAVHFNPGTAKEQEEEKEVLLVRGNFERRSSNFPASEQVCEFVSKFKDDWEEFQVLLKRIFIRE